MGNYAPKSLVCPLWSADWDHDCFGPWVWPNLGMVKGYIYTSKIDLFQKICMYHQLHEYIRCFKMKHMIKPSWIYIIGSEKHNFLHSVSRCIFQTVNTFETNNLFCLGRLSNSQRLESGLKVAPMTVRVSCRDPAATVQLKTLPGKPKGNPWCGADWMCIMLVWTLGVIFLFQLGSFGVALLMCLNSFVMEEGFNALMRICSKAKCSVMRDGKGFMKQLKVPCVSFGQLVVLHVYILFWNRQGMGWEQLCQLQPGGPEGQQWWNPVNMVKHQG